MQYFAHVSKNNLTFCLNYHKYRLSQFKLSPGRAVFSITGISTLPSVIPVVPKSEMFYHQGM